jgi:hypothetical protein
MRAMTSVALPAQSEREHQVQLRRAVIASGTAIECYGFFLHSTITGLVFATLFYPNSDPLVGRWKRSPPSP